MANKEISEALAPGVIEGVAKGHAVSQLWGFAIAAQTLVTSALYRFNKDAPIGQLGKEAWGLLAATTIAGIVVEARTIREKGYSPNSLSTVAHEIVRDPYVSALAGTVLGTGLSLLLNPNNAIAIGSLASGDGGRFVYTTMESAAAVGFVYLLTVNGLVRSGKVEEALGAVKAVYEKSGLRRLDESLFPERVPWYPDQAPEQATRVHYGSPLF